MKEQVKNLVNRLELEINKTPTGELRNLLTDANIIVHQILTTPCKVPESLVKCNKEYGDWYCKGCIYNLE